MYPSNPSFFLAARSLIERCGHVFLQAGIGFFQPDFPLSSFNNAGESFFLSARQAHARQVKGHEILLLNHRRPQQIGRLVS